MTHEQFVWWLEGFLDGGADMDLDVRTQIREKLNLIGAAPEKKQPLADRPRTPDDTVKRYIEGIGVGVASPGVVNPIGGWPSGAAGVIASAALGIAAHEPTTLCMNMTNNAST
ncbi:hypothetical protein [Paraburkholderia sp.]|uniref:hypothetical protein n=1 Tax=Paraburkholderia sp. TaxID=1926495 RepID=UPI0039E5FA06